jgi:hypothetical protein
MLSLKIDFPTFPDATLKTSSGQTTYCDSDDFSIGTTLDLSADYTYVWTKMEVLYLMRRAILSK